MDLSFNFAAPAASGSQKKAAKGKSGASSANGSGKSLRWTERMKQQQTGRRKTGPSGANHKERKPASVGSETPAKTARKEQASSQKTEHHAPQMQLDEEDRYPEASTSVLKKAAKNDSQPAKQQVISSLFDRGPNGKTSAKSNGTTSGKAMEQDKATQAVLDPSNAPSLSDDFDSMNLRADIVRHLKGKMSLAHPTTIQKLAVPFLCKADSRQRDALLQAQTGSGKTLSYLLPILQDLITVADSALKRGQTLDRNVGTMAIILVPTRELANQISEVASKLLSFSVSEGSASHRWITPGLLTGGAHRQHEKARLRKGVPLLIATPGRLLDHLEATKAFRLAGEVIRKPADPSRRKNNDEDGETSEDEFAYEDAVKDTSTQAAPAGNDDISSDEDFEGMAVSRSHRSNAALPKIAGDLLSADLTLRWLVLDEADRLMDMGFEPQISSIIQLLEARLEKRKAAVGRALTQNSLRHRLSGQQRQHVVITERRTLLCSATIDEKVEKLAGIALNAPLLIKGDENESSATKEDDGKLAKSAAKYAPPRQLVQNYVTVSPKLRFVALVALLRQVLLTQRHQGVKQRVLVFLSCTDSVDLHWNALAGLHLGKDSEVPQKKPTNGKLDSKTMLLPGTAVYRLHGSLDLQTRLGSLKGFSQDTKESAILLCTSVAARGLDVQDVTCVVQYDLPTEGGVTEYVHRVGRTARAGMAGQSWAFLLPSEVGWVQWAESEMQQGNGIAGTSSLRERDVEGLLKGGFGGKDQRDYETRATDVQMAFERWAIADLANTSLAKKAFSSHVRAYATHPSNEKQYFHVKNLHLGHLAKAFGLREAPAGIGGAVQSKGKFAAASAKGTKRKRGQDAEESSDDEVAALQEERKTIPRSGRALEGKGLHGPKGTTGRDFNIANTQALEAMLQRKRR